MFKFNRMKKKHIKHLIKKNVKTTKNNLYHLTNIFLLYFNPVFSIVS